MTYKNAKGAIPRKPGDELSESIIERGRGHCEEMEKEVDALRAEVARLTGENRELLDIARTFVDVFLNGSNVIRWPLVGIYERCAAILSQESTDENAPADEIRPQ